MTNENIENKKVEILCIGDTVVEPFIKLEKAEVHCNIDNSGCTITLPFGAKIPYESATICAGVGNSANAAVAIARLGISSGIATELGDDENGKLCLDNFKNEKVNIDHVISHENIPTNYHYVLWYPPERTILVKHNTYPKKWRVENFKNGNPNFIYLSSLPADSLDYHFEIIEWLKANRNVKLVFQPGTFQMKLGVEALKPLYTMCHLFIVNKEESQYILNTTEKEIQKLLEGITKLGPEIACITDGPNGAYIRFKENGVWKNFYMPIYPDLKAPFERTGAGDAFASTLTAMLASGKSPIDAIKYSPINSMNVVQHVGAQAGLLTLAEIESLLEKAPKDYKPVEI